MVHYLLSLLCKTKGAAAFVLTTVVGVSLAFITPYVNGVFLDFLLSNRSEGDALAFALLVAAIGVLAALFGYFSGTLSVQVSSKVSFMLLKRVVLHYERTDYQASRSVEPAYATQRIIADSNAVSSFVLNNFISAPLSIVAVPVVLLVIWSIDPAISVFSIALLLGYLGLIAGLRRLLYMVTYERKEADSKFYAAIASQLSQLLNIQLSSAYMESARRLSAGFSQYFPKVLRSGKITYTLSSLDGLLSAVFQAVVLVVSGIRIIRGTMTIGEYTIVASYFGVLFRTLKNLMTLFRSYQDARASWDRINEILEKLDESASASVRLAGLDVMAVIQVRDLSYSVVAPDGTSRQIISNFSYVFSKPHTYCIIGENGSGKTSLLYLLLGLCGSSAGSVTINGRLIEECDMSAARGNLISCCPQACYAPDEAVKDLLEFLGTPYSADWLENDMPLLSNGIESLLEKRCSSLSGGELRRVYLWSAIARNAPVLMLDEPTTGLDAPSRSELAAYIKRNASGRLIILVSHDAELIESVEHVIDVMG